MKASSCGFGAVPSGERVCSRQQKLLVVLETQPSYKVTASLVVATKMENNSQYLMIGKVWMSHTDGSESLGLGALCICCQIVYSTGVKLKLFRK